MRLENRFRSHFVHVRLVFSLLALIVCSPSSFADKEGKCILPEADGGIRDPSEPSVYGQIVQVNLGLIVVREDKNHKRREIRVDGKTAMFTVYGGYVAMEKLTEGQQVKIWYVGCNAKAAGSPPLAAVVQFETCGWRGC